MLGPDGKFHEIQAKHFSFYIFLTLIPDFGAWHDYLDLCRVYPPLTF